MTNDLTALIAEARALDAAATPGPWTTDVWCGTDGGVAARGPHLRSDEDDEPGAEHYVRAEADAALIARARTLLPQLADAVERLQAERDELLAGFDYEQQLRNALHAKYDAALDRAEAAEAGHDKEIAAHALTGQLLRASIAEHDKANARASLAEAKVAAWSSLTPLLDMLAAIVPDEANYTDEDVNLAALTVCCAYESAIAALAAIEGAL